MIVVAAPGLATVDFGKHRKILKPCKLRLRTAVPCLAVLCPRERVPSVCTFAGRIQNNHTAGPDRSPRKSSVVNILSAALFF